MHSDHSSDLSRRDVLKTCAAAAVGTGLSSAKAAPVAAAESSQTAAAKVPTAATSKDRGEYTGEHLNRVAFPLGGMGAGMICLEGTGALSHVSLRNKPEVFHEPCTFAAISVKGQTNVARVLEGPVPSVW